MLSGWILLNKPVGISSRNVGNIVRRKLGVKKFGHIGTLDPKASGLLPIILNDATRFAFGLEKCDKSYIAEIQLGGKSTTDDIEGEITSCNPININLLNPEYIKNQLQTFVGHINQTPPNYCAIRVDGQRLYKTERKIKNSFSLATPPLPVTEPLKAPPRLVRIDKIEVLEINIKAQSLKILINCGSGTYIRSIARDLGILMGNGGYLLSLERVGFDKFTLADSVTLTEFENLDFNSIVQKHLKSGDELIYKLLPLNISKQSADKLYLGQQVILNDIFPNQKPDINIFRLYANTVFIGVGEVTCENNIHKLVAKRLLPQTL